MLRTGKYSETGLVRIPTCLRSSLTEDIRTWQRSRRAINLQVADFVTDQDRRPQVGLQLPIEPAGGFGGAEPANQVVQGSEVDGEPGLAGRDGEGDGEHGFADAGRPEQCDVGPGGHELQRGEVADLAGVEAGLEGEVEVVEGFVVRQPGQLQGVTEAAALPQPDLFLEQQVNEVEVAHLRGFGTLDELGDGLGEMGQAELGGVVADPVGGQGAHRSSFRSELAAAWA